MRPAHRAIRAPHAVLQLEDAPRADGFLDDREDLGLVFGKNIVVEPGAAGPGRIGNEAPSIQRRHLAPIGAHPVDHIRTGRHETTEARLARGQRGGGLLALGDVLDGEHDERRKPGGLREAARIQEHDARADLRESVAHLEVINPLLLRQQLLEQRAQRGDVPLPVAEVVNQPPLGLLQRHAEAFAKRAARRLHAQPRIQHHERHAHAGHDALGVIARQLQRAVEPREFQAALVQLVIDRGQLLVARLDFLLRGFQLLIHALHFLVRRLRLFIGALQFLVRALLLLDHRLQILPRRREFLRQPGDFVGILNFEF